MDAVVLVRQDSSSSAGNADAFVNRGFQTTTMFNNSSQIDGKVSVSNFFVVASLIKQLRIWEHNTAGI
jgi:hypothetical protein